MFKKKEKLLKAAKESSSFRNRTFPQTYESGIKMNTGNLCEKFPIELPGYLILGK